MKIHGSVRIVRGENGSSYAATFRPLGGSRATGPGLVLADRRALETFLVERVLLSRRDAAEAAAAVARNGSSALPGLWLRDDEIDGLGLGRVAGLQAPGPAAGEAARGGADSGGAGYSAGSTAGYTSTGATTPMRAARSGPSLFSPASAATL